MINTIAIKSVIGLNFILLGLIFIEPAPLCSGAPKADKELNTAAQMKQIQRDTELDFPPSAVVERFVLRNAEYNPNWLAKLNMPKQAGADFKTKALAKKSLSNVFFKPPKEAWWKPAQPTLVLHYLTSINSFVTVVTSEENQRCVIYLQWTCP
ncbi:MAG: hypothetical protein QM796_10805 [Chthoniobacteraceae bacterium]